VLAVWWPAREKCVYRGSPAMWSGPEAHAVAPVDDLPHYRDLVLLWDIHDVDGPRGIPANFGFILDAEVQP
jgi:hypothetical protein